MPDVCGAGRRPRPTVPSTHLRSGTPGSGESHSAAYTIRAAGEPLDTAPGCGHSSGHTTVWDVERGDFLFAPLCLKSSLHTIFGKPPPRCWRCPVLYRRQTGGSRGRAPVAPPPRQGAVRSGGGGGSRPSAAVAAALATASHARRRRPGDPARRLAGHLPLPIFQVSSGYG